jgi:signal transduction histidine kinase
MIAAEQDERRRIALFLHDGPVQSLSGIALMLDAALNSVETGRLEEAKTIMANALDRHRQTIRELRDLSFALEPVVLRDQGFGPAFNALAEQIGISNKVQVDLDVEAAETLGENAQVALYTILRESLDQAIRRGPPTRISVSVARTADGGVDATIADDGADERRRRSFEGIEERVRQLHGTVVVDAGADGGTEVRVSLPPYTAQR